MSVVAGVLVAAAVTPAIAVADSAATSGISVFDNLPDYITVGAESQQNEIFAVKDGKPVQIATTYDQNRQEVGWSDISTYLKDAAVDGEDRRFYSHGGVDIPSVVRAAIFNTTESQNGVSGSSTLDMQLVKNILVQQALQLSDASARKAAYAAAISDTFSRKLKEMKLAIGLDQKYSKKQILAAYLNITGFGGNTYGVEAASEEYFSTTADKLTVAQAASLIATVQQPNLQNLGSTKNYAANKVRRDEILADMYAAKDITKAQYDTASATPIASEVKFTAPTSGCLYASDAQFACDYVQRLVPTLASLGSTATERTQNWAHGGYKIYTSIDLTQQDVAQTALSADAPANETRFALGAAADAVQPGTGRILVMAQNKVFDDSATGDPVTTTAVNYSTDKAYGGSSGFQTGSTYKIFTLTDWLQKGHGLNDVVNGSVRTFQQSSFNASECSAPFAGTYTPQNDSPGEGGSMTVLQATANSVNAAFVGMAQQLDMCDIRNDAQAMGVHRADGSPLVVSPSSVLGINEIAPLTMAGAIATIGDGGMYCAPTIVDSITDPNGKTLPGQAKSCTQSIDPTIAATDAYALASVMTSGTGTPGNPRDGVPIVGKTGTTDGAYQNWLIASTTKAALAVWVGNIQGTASLRSTKDPQGDQNLRNITIAGTNGYNTKFNIFRVTMKSLDTNPDYRGGTFPSPDPTLLEGSGVTVPSVVGEQPSEAESVLEGLGFTATDGGTVASGLPVGEVASTDPAAGTSAALGSEITYYTSDGTLAKAMPNVVGQSKHNAIAMLVADGFSSSNITITWTTGTVLSVCTVTASNPVSGAATSTDSPVTLTVSDGGATSGTDPGTCT
ncbi:MAG: penicillin-binding protein [Microbacteriaceae bacterium]|nr:penicillin-binding protein [Microbacteriaceae bacterium]